MDPNELAIQSAIGDLRSGVYTSLRKAACAHNVPRSTLQDRLQGRQSHATAHQHQQRLTPEQEDFIADWILDRDSRDQTASRTQIRELVTQILCMKGEYEPLGQLWIHHFFARHPRVAVVAGRNIKNTMSLSAGHATIQGFLEASDCTRVELDIRCEDVQHTEKTRGSLGVSN